MAAWLRFKVGVSRDTITVCLESILYLWHLGISQMVVEILFKL